MSLGADAAATRGVDIETKREIYLRLRQMAASGTAVVLLSSDTLELVHVCDRVAVFSRGRIAALLNRSQLSEEARPAALAPRQRSRVTLMRAGTVAVRVEPDTVTVWPPEDVTV